MGVRLANRSLGWGLCMKGIMFRARERLMTDANLRSTRVDE